MDATQAMDVRFRDVAQEELWDLRSMAERMPATMRPMSEPSVLA